jgi:hypothetical protein
MAYIYAATNTIKIALIDRSVGDVASSPAIVLYGFSVPDFEEESKEYKTANYQIRTDNIGVRQLYKCTFTNNEFSGNLQSTLMTLLGWVPYVKANTHYLKLWPHWDSDYLEESLECFNCVLRDYYKIEKLHDTLDLGSDLELTFIEMTPNKSYTPKVPYLKTDPTVPVIFTSSQFTGA